jgi:putative colanic acid biosynthesis acetyltransferase WcaF
VLWGLAHPLFRCSPRPMWAWRRILLRLFGASIGCDVHIFPSVRIAIPWTLQIGDQAAVGDYAILYSLGSISIGARATISQYAHLCAGTHDHRSPAMTLLKMPIAIGDDAWICAEAFIGPGVMVGERAIVGARAVAVRAVPPGTIVAGNPARRIGMRSADAGEVPA